MCMTLICITLCELCWSRPCVTVCVKCGFKGSCRPLAQVLTAITTCFHCTSLATGQSPQISLLFMLWGSFCETVTQPVFLIMRSVSWSFHVPIQSSAFIRFYRCTGVIAIVHFWRTYLSSSPTPTPPKTTTHTPKMNEMKKYCSFP